MMTTLGSIRRGEAATNRLAAATNSLVQHTATPAVNDYRSQFYDCFGIERPEGSPLESEFTSQDVAELIARHLAYDEGKIVDMFNRALQQTTRHNQGPVSSVSRPAMSGRDLPVGMSAAQLVPGTATRQEAIFRAIVQERRRQDNVHGGAAHDDRHDYLEWADFIQQHLNHAHDEWIQGNLREVRRRAICIAAVAVAMGEAIDRNGNQALDLVGQEARPL